MLLSLLFSLLPQFVFAAEFPAVYEVPVRPGLEAYSRYPMPPVRVEEEGKVVRMHYTLPLKLTGLENRVELSGVVGPDGVLRLEGENGSAICGNYETNGECHVKYEKVQMDLGLVAQELERLKLSPVDKAGFLEVSAGFGGDMQGIVHYGPR